MNPLRDWYVSSTLALLAAAGALGWYLRPWQAAASRTFAAEARWNGQLAWSGQARSGRLELDQAGNLELVIQLPTGSVHLYAAAGDTLTLQGIDP